VAGRLGSAELVCVGDTASALNVDEPSRRSHNQGIARLATLPVVLPMHPRTRERVRAFGFEDLLGPLRVMEPVGYVEMLGLQDAAGLILTDSGGVQEESSVLGVPCVTLREATERPVTITQGTNALVPWPPTESGILEAVNAALSKGRAEVGERAPEGWDGRAGTDRRSACQPCDVEQSRHRAPPGDGLPFAQIGNRGGYCLGFCYIGRTPTSHSCNEASA
jgi:UDP-N-acetylglucosamine 2-epimerase (non-hydrolysing)